MLVRLALPITSLAIVVSAPFAGLVADRIGRKPVLEGSLALYAVSGTAGYFIADRPALLASRAVLGLAVGGVMTGISALITDWFEGAERARFLGLQQAFASLGGVVFLPIAGVLAQTASGNPESRRDFQTGHRNLRAGSRRHARVLHGTDATSFLLKEFGASPAVIGLWSPVAR